MAPSASIVVRRPSDRELDAVVACIENSFAIRFPDAERAQFLGGAAAMSLFAAFDGAELVGTIAHFGVSQTLPGPRDTQLRAIGEVAVLPTHRRRGILTMMMRRVLDDLHAAGESLAILQASEAAIHGRFGFGPAMWAARYRVAHAAAVFDPAAVFDLPGAVRLLSRSEAQLVLPTVHEEARRAQVGEIARIASWWEELFDEDTAGHPARFYAAYVEAGQITGYSIYEVVTVPGGPDRREVLCIEHYALSRAAHVGLYRFLCDLDLTDGMRTMDRPLDDGLRHLFIDPRVVQTLEVRDLAWLRLIDVRAALGLRRYSAGGRFVLQVNDAVCDWNTGRFVLEIDAHGTPEVIASEAPVDIVVSASALGACYLGGTSLSALFDAGSVLERTAGAVARLDACLHSARAPFCGTSF